MPRKSNVSQPGNGEENALAKEKADGINIEDLSLPRTMVQRLAKGVLPPNTQIQKDAIVAMSKGATVFINHIADKANELTLSTNKRTITPLNVLEALSQCEYEDFLPRVKAELDKFNEIATGKRNEYRRKIKEKETGVSPNGEKKDVVVNGSGDVNGETGTEGDEREDGEERARKRVRREESTEEVEKEDRQGQRQLVTASTGGTPEEEDEERYDTAMEDEATGAGEGGEVVQDDDSELSDDEVEEDERDVEQVDMETALDPRTDGLSSGADDDDEEDEESD
ncbi:MAG: hypothetical protein Q9204_002051 [Flavoplaca sp. TL-2023a]